MTLREPVALLPPGELGRVHFLAVGGAGMSAVAQCFLDLGVPVSGCDRADSAALAELARRGAPVCVGHDPSHLAGTDTLVVSSAIAPDVPELVAAERREGLRVWHRSAALGSLMLGHDGVAVTGTHGKTTTSAMVFTALRAAGADPSGVIGGTMGATGTSHHLGGGEVFVVEADESDGSYRQYPAPTVVITNIEADHLDNWGTAQAYAEGFERLVRQPGVRRVVLDVDDPGAAALAERLAGGPARVITVGTGSGAQVRLSGLVQDGTTGQATLEADGTAYALRLPVPGRHNLHNAAVAFATGRALGAPADGLLDGLAGFGGTLRRFQSVGEAVGVRVFDDYAHHPTELRAALDAARPLVGEGRLIACFQPHLFTRTRDFAEAFGRALALADLVVVTDVYAAREAPLPGVTGELVARAAEAAGADVAYVPDKADLAGALAGLVRPGDVVVTLGAGDVTRVGPALVAALAGGGGDV